MHCRACGRHIMTWQHAKAGQRVNIVWVGNQRENLCPACAELYWTICGDFSYWTAKKAAMFGQDGENGKWAVWDNGKYVGYVWLNEDYGTWKCSPSYGGYCYKTKDQAIACLKHYVKCMEGTYENSKKTYSRRG